MTHMRCSPHHKEDGSTFYTTCRCNCGGNFQCVVKAHVKGGRVVAIEPDDRYNRNIGREDAVLEDQDLLKVRLQRRPCVMGLVFHIYNQHPERILHPLKRAPGSRRGEGRYVRISWDEAVDTIATKMKEIRDKYGPLSIITPYMPNETVERLFSFWGAGAEGWGWCSYDAARLMAQMITGEKPWALEKWSSGSAPDMLANSNAILLWGCDPTVGHQGPAHMFAWYIKLARERGKPVIIIDPRYSTAVRTLADQWIPIKPGTDVAMFMGMAHVLFQDDTWDKDFVERFVESKGFQKWKDYVLGKSDGIEKSPEWAEERCSVPSETIRALARMVWDRRPCWTWAHWSLSRKSHGEQVITSFAALQAMLGNWGNPGGGPAIHPGPHRDLPIGLFSTFWGENGPYEVPKLYRSHYWAQAVLLLEKVRKGELSGEEYMKKVGWRADPGLLKDFNPKMLFWGGGSKPHASNHLVTACDSTNDQVKALEKMEFVVSMHAMMNPTVQHADIVLPAQNPMWEEKDITRSAPYGTFECVNANPKVIDPPGEVKQWVLVYIKIAEKLGIDPKRFFKYYTSEENWEKDWERYLKDVYDGLEDYYEAKGTRIPSYEDFCEGNFINCDELDDIPHTGWDQQVKEGKPFSTKSGKIELYSDLLADEDERGKGEHYDAFGNLYQNLPADWGMLTPSPTYMLTIRGMDDPLAKEYPLMLLTSHSRYRVHYVFWDHPWLRNHVYRHRVWISLTDARVRGIKDNDLVVVYNDRGKVVMPAYVTPRMMPGVALIHHGGNYEPDKSGIDFGASASTLMGGDTDSCFAAARATNLVEIKKCEGQ
ncbi:MAG: molybdopterin-dependent oxidoreductase [Deltaproteobacteria bacterium]|nr:molybdopterin-dependent oxidoreductase [Deltaproteobacteria bacterium]MBW2138687.1 molybdopterin-dependent oxidoreductase [Deltaproteobacteria bacterium]